MATAVKGLTFDEKKAEILKKYKLDFKIIKTELQANILLPDGGLLVVPSGYYGLYNDKAKKVINTVKKGYTVSQTDEVVAVVLKGTEGFGNLSVTMGGSIHDGRKIYLQLKIEGMGRVGNDKLVRYVTIIDSNDGSTGLSVGVGNLTMSCKNQFFKFYKAGEMGGKHTGSLQAKILALPSLITLALSEDLQLMENFETFQKTKASKELVNNVMSHILGYDVKEETNPRALKNMSVFQSHMDKEIADKGLNYWGIFSGVTSWTTHEKGVPKRPNGRMESIITGTNYKANLKAYDYLLEQL